MEIIKIDSNEIKREWDREEMGVCERERGKDRGRERGEERVRERCEERVRERGGEC